MRNIFFCQGIKQCVQETCNHDVISAYLNARNYDVEWERRHGLFNRPVHQIMRREVNEFAIVQKDISGLEIMHEEYKKRLSRYGVTPNMWPVVHKPFIERPALHSQGFSFSRIVLPGSSPPKWQFMPPWSHLKRPLIN